jgi:predicted AlkP superfamily pyrophosphatase or phosphodiesterase
LLRTDVLFAQKGLKNTPQLLKRTMKKNLLILLILPAFLLTAQTKQALRPAESSKAPKLIVGIVIDQMRYDYLYRFMAKFGNDGFKRLMSQGHNCRNANYNYAPTYTGPGHASIYTGTPPGIHGIIGNNWYDRVKGKSVYCTDDKTVSTVGAPGNAGQMSPRNMIANTITDEVHQASNGYSKVIGVALKDRGAILPAGHTANAAYWYDASGSWITSTYYMKELPAWVDKFNKKELAQKYMSQNWNTVLPLDQYIESSEDNNKYESKFKGETAPVFPHHLPELMAANGNLDMIRSTPFGNSLTKDFAIEAINEESLGKGFATDFLTISFSSTDYVGHAYGPHSIELEDTYIRLDKDLAELLKFLDGYIGKDNVLLFLTADHAVLDVPQYLIDRKIPAGYFDYHLAIDSLKHTLRAKYGDTLVLAYANQQIYLNQPVIDSKNIQQNKLEQEIADFLIRFPGVASCVTAHALKNTSFEDVDLRSFVQKGYQPKRSGDVMIILQPAWIESEKTTGTTHGSPYSYDTHVPLLWYGWGIHAGSSTEPVHTIDIAPTISMLLNIPFPDGCTGKPIPAVVAPSK